MYVTVRGKRLIKVTHSHVYWFRKCKETEFMVHNLTKVTFPSFLWTKLTIKNEKYKKKSKQKLFFNLIKNFWDHARSNDFQVFSIANKRTPCMKFRQFSIAVSDYQNEIRVNHSCEWEWKKSDSEFPRRNEH